jgi:PAS domain S-box-containing protein
MHDEQRPILLVEDNRGDARLIEHALGQATEAQWPVIWAERLSEAMTRLSEQEFAVVLLDLSLPDSWGFDTIASIQTRAPNLPIVVLTDLDDEEFAIKAVQEGAQDYVVKGQMIPRTLIRTVRYAIERHRLRHELQQSETRYRNLFENASDAILSVNTNGVIVEVNNGLETMLGWTREELIGQDYRRLLTPRSVTEVEDRIRRLLRGERPPQLPPTIEVEAVRKSQSIVPVEARENVLYNTHGRPIGVLAMARDISERKELERKRSEFLAMLSHDIKNPLAVLIGYADYLQNEVSTSGTAKSIKVLPWIKSSGLTILSLVNNYLDLSRIEDQQLILAHEPVAVNELLRRIGSQYEGEAQHRMIAFDLQLHPQIPVVKGDPLALDRVFANLVYNALKFTPKDGKVTVSSQLYKNEVWVSVADTGPGIVPEDIPLLFEKYRRAAGARRKEGMGLGLYIVKTLIECQGGRVEVESTSGNGTTFHVILPTK